MTTPWKRTIKKAFLIPANETLHFHAHGKEGMSIYVLNREPNDIYIVVHEAKKIRKNKSAKL